MGTLNTIEENDELEDVSSPHDVAGTPTIADSIDRQGAVDIPLSLCDAGARHIGRRCWSAGASRVFYDVCERSLVSHSPDVGVDVNVSHGAGGGIDELAEDVVAAAASPDAAATRSDHESGRKRARVHMRRWGACPVEAVCIQSLTHSKSSSSSDVEEDAGDGYIDWDVVSRADFSIDGSNTAGRSAIDCEMRDRHWKTVRQAREVYEYQLDFPESDAALQAQGFNIRVLRPPGDSPVAERERGRSRRRTDMRITPMAVLDREQLADTIELAQQDCVLVQWRHSPGTADNAGSSSSDSDVEDEGEAAAERRVPWRSSSSSSSSSTDGNDDGQMRSQVGSADDRRLMRLDRSKCTALHRILARCLLRLSIRLCCLLEPLILGTDFDRPPR